MQNLTLVTLPGISFLMLNMFLPARSFVLCLEADQIKKTCWKATFTSLS